MALHPAAASAKDALAGTGYAPSADREVGFVKFRSARGEGVRQVSVSSSYFSLQKTLFKMQVQELQELLKQRDQEIAILIAKLKRERALNPDRASRPTSPRRRRSSFMAERILDRAFPVVTIFNQSSVGCCFLLVITSS